MQVGRVEQAQRGDAEAFDALVIATIVAGPLNVAMPRTAPGHRGSRELVPHTGFGTAVALGRVSCVPNGQELTVSDRSDRIVLAKVVATGHGPADH